MRLSRVVVLVLMTVSLIAFVRAQQQNSPPPSQREFVPQGIDELRQGASSKTEFTLDHSMLILASKLDPNNEDLRRVIAGVSGVSVHNFRYAKPGTFDPQAVESVREDYRSVGWKQVMNKSEKNGGTGLTDVWVRLENNAISNVAILVAKSNEVDFFVVSGSISPIDIAHLGGHFGLPKIEGGVEVPNTARR
ncbi:MAG: DUF4252 domain-containing protein [Terriglobales bacterium]|jgi:Domain of unknown function (DUF4252)